MNSHILYRFGDFRLDPANRELRRGDEEVSLPPKSFDCVVYLVEHRDRAVGRDELIAAVWHHDNLSDSLVGQTILTARRALDDTGEDSQIIKTVRGYGYRWVAPVEAISIPAPKPVEAEQRKTVWRWMGLAAVPLVLAAGFAIYFWPDRAAEDTVIGMPGVEEGDLALLLPVEVENRDDGSDAWMRLGIMELINERLRAAGQAMVPSDNVISLAGTLSAEPTEEDLANLTAVTGARLLLAARVDSRGSRWRVTLRSLDGVFPPITSQGESEDILEAARTAADYAALSMGHTPPPEADAEPGLALLVQQITAARLAQQHDVARELIESADLELREHPEIRFQSAILDAQSARSEAAVAAYEKLLDETPAEQNPGFRARILHNLGAIRLNSGDLSGAKRFLEEAVGLLDESNSLDHLAYIRASVGFILLQEGELETAAAHFARMRGPLEAGGDVLGLAGLDSYLAALEIARERWVDAQAYLSKAAERATSIHSLGNEIQARANMVYVQLELLNTTAAMEIEPRLRELAAQIGSPQAGLQADVTRAYLLFANGRTNTAEKLLTEALAIMEGDESLRQHWHLATHIRAAQAARENDWIQAAQSAAAVVEPPNRYHDSPWSVFWLGRTWLILVRAELVLGNAEAAAEAAHALADWAARTNFPAARVYALLARAELAAAQGRVEAARTDFERALSLADTGHAPRRVLDVAEAYIHWLLLETPDKPADSDRAAIVFDRVARFADHDFDTAVLQLRLYHAAGLTSAWRIVLNRAQSLAGERRIPPELLSPPGSNFAGQFDF